VLAFSIAAITGFARIAVGAHFPCDVLGGAILGALTAHLVVRVVDEYFERRRVAL
jgi:membrane-associated phospholipid phosphatase